VTDVPKGGAQAIEDAAVLARLFSRSLSKSDIPHLIEAFEALRKPRTERIQDAARLNMLYWQLPDGLEQEQRDMKLSETLKIEEDVRRGHGGDGSEVKPDKNARFGEPGFQRWLFGTDVMREAAEMLSLLY
jgi:salicylate hydroxylase